MLIDSLAHSEIVSINFNRNNVQFVFEGECTTYTLSLRSYPDIHHQDNLYKDGFTGHADMLCSLINQFVSEVNCEDDDIRLRFANMYVLEFSRHHVEFFEAE